MEKKLQTEAQTQEPSACFKEKHKYRLRIPNIKFEMFWNPKNFDYQNDTQNIAGFWSMSYLYIRNILGGIGEVPDKVFLCSAGCPRTHSVDQAGL